jgi:hypothetical protein
LDVLERLVELLRHCKTSSKGRCSTPSAEASPLLNFKSIKNSPLLIFK